VARAMPIPAKPTADPTWATNANYAGGPDVGTATKIDPGAGIRADGWRGGAGVAAQHENHRENAQGQWIAWAEDGIDDLASRVGGNDGTGEWTYPTPRTRTVVVHAAQGYDATPGAQGWRGVAIGGAGNAYAVQAKANDAILVVPLNRIVPHGASITLIEAMVTLGDARAGANRVQVSWQQPVLDWGAPSASYGALEDTADDGGAAGGATVVITCTPTPAIALASLGNAWPVAIVLKAGNNASGNPDNVHGFRVTFTDDLGPRNF
jgi:hypothetical protein